MSKEYSNDDIEIIFSSLSTEQKIILSLFTDKDIEVAVQANKDISRLIEDKTIKPPFVFPLALKEFTRMMGIPTERDRLSAIIEACLRSVRNKSLYRNAWLSLLDTFGFQPREDEIVMHLRDDFERFEEGNVYENERVKVATLLSEGVHHGIGISELQDDIVLVSNEPDAVILTDGMGGQKNGRKAAKIGTKRMSEALQKAQKDGLTQQRVTQAFQEGYYQAVADIDESSNPDDAVKAMGTTLTAYVLYEENNQEKLTFCHAGDSALFAIMADGSIQRLTRIHGFALGFVQEDETYRNDPTFITDLENFLDTYNGRTNSLESIQEWCERNMPDMSPLAKSVAHIVWQNRNRVQAINANGEHIDPQIETIVLPENWIGLLDASDGMFDVLTTSDIESVIKNGLKNKQTPQQITMALYKEARGLKNTMSIRHKVDDIAIIFTFLKKRLTQIQ